MREPTHAKAAQSSRHIGQVDGRHAGLRVQAPVGLATCASVSARKLPELGIATLVVAGRAVPEHGRNDPVPHFIDRLAHTIDVLEVTQVLEGRCLGPLSTCLTYASVSSDGAHGDRWDISTSARATDDSYKVSRCEASPLPKGRGSKGREDATPYHCGPITARLRRYPRPTLKHALESSVSGGMDQQA